MNFVIHPIRICLKNLFTGLFLKNLVFHLLRTDADGQRHLLPVNGTPEGKI